MLIVMLFMAINYSIRFKIIATFGFSKALITIFNLSLFFLLVFYLMEWEGNVVKGTYFFLKL